MNWCGMIKMKLLLKLPLIVVLHFGITACSNEKNVDVEEVTGQQNLLPKVELAMRVSPLENGTHNEEAPIPPQCYTKTESVHNPCYTCHQNYSRTDEAEYRYNKRDDGANQGIYTFSEVGETNSWSNLFVDKSDWVAQISDEAILKYINQDNYSQLKGNLESRGWEGFIPDLANFQLGSEAFETNGIAKDGSAWVAFNYKPFPGTFWPTNGATDDVLIRLPQKFRQYQSNDNQDIYWINLSLMEMSIKGLDEISIFPIDEIAINLDINQDGKLENAVELLKVQTHFAGDANDVPVPQQQYPAGTEIMHSVRYVGVTESGEITIPKRMKELRYMKKTSLMSEADIDNQYRRERKEKLDEQLPSYTRIRDKGFNNKFGWQIKGFIEDYDGNLRPQGYEEDFFCMGCHAAIGTTIDQTFSFPRKVTGRDGWGYINLKGMVDAPNKGQTEGEILQYLRLNGGGSEFRENDEMTANWYNPDGTLNEEKVKQADVYELITPSPERALALNKAYTYIVRHQSYNHGRDANISPVVNVYKEIDESNPPLEAEHRFDGWDIRLIDWTENKNTRIEE